MVNKKIYIYHLAPRMHSSMRLMIENPPKGYEFIISENERKIKTLNFLLNSKFIKFIYKKIIKMILNPLKLYNKIYSTRVPKNIDLIFSSGSALDIKFPYVIEILDSPYSLAGYDYNLFIKNKKGIEEKLLSPYCKKIIVVNETSLRLMKKYFSKEIMKKAVLVRAAIEKQNIKKNYFKKKIQIIFVGSIANPDDFYLKGGLQAFEVFKRLSEEFDNISFLVSCKVPKEIKEKAILKNLTIIKHKLKSEEIKNVYMNSDIMLNPGNIYVLMATLEAMSYGIPIVFLDTYGVRDYIKNNVNGLLIKPSNKIKGYKANDYPCNIRTKEFLSEIKQIDERVINELHKAVKKLIKNPKLREKLGKQGKKLAETKFSLEKRNKMLKKIFDEATK